MNTNGKDCVFMIYVESVEDFEDDKIYEIDKFLKFFNQLLTRENKVIITKMPAEKVFYEVWDRNRLYFHS